VVPGEPPRPHQPQADGAIRTANNWLASFPRGETAWSYDEGRGQWYLRCFLHQQPDLNWDNPEVEAAMHATLRFWLDKGVDGFRMDVVHLIGKDLAKNDPPECAEHQWGHIVYNDEAVTHERLRAIRAVLDEYEGDRMASASVSVDKQR
jgi:alpha-glucosidase